jgi:hypothetical protein
MYTYYSYFETTPETGFLDSDSYEKAARLLGRPCLDIFLIVEGKLVLAERSQEPIKGVWTTGGRIIWNDFKNPVQYAFLTAQKQFGINVTDTACAHILKPRFVCFKKRPYPEILTWVAITITPKLFATIKLNTDEQNELLIFTSRNQLIAHLQETYLSDEHSALMTDLYDELLALHLLQS